ncbi:HNH endonuclease [Bacillus safensis]|uniref:HNH endonuclease n=1 Tax=Bacillus safensis TaxID=561879 RepID=UPI00227DC847|nr:HNH endonuclease [Bacillus safensis]MCY7676779.1 HNH endonuclease [Bacillus safensis]MCY7700067.1 HNH endonuclease [Bacillus safensis]MEC3627100.1 HNH endonuclease [Bacillus safensis]
MPTMPLRICASPRCSSLTRGRYCDSHQKHQQEETKHYNKHSRNKTITSFYKSTDWKRTRELVLLRDNHLCQRCLRKNRFIPADMVHHIVEVKRDWHKRLDISNLESLCNACHNKVHGNRNKLI